MYQSIDTNVTSNVKLLGIDGVKPTKKTIKDETYPLHTSYYIIINANDDSDSKAKILADQMLSSRGQLVAENAGYIPVK